MKKSTVEKLRAQLRASRKRIRDLELACAMYSQEGSRLRREIADLQRTYDPHDYASGM